MRPPPKKKYPLNNNAKHPVKFNWIQEMSENEGQRIQYIKIILEQEYAEWIMEEHEAMRVEAKKNILKIHEVD